MYQGIEFPDTRLKLAQTQREIDSDPRLGFISEAVIRGSDLAVMLNSR